MDTNFYIENYLPWVENGAILNENITSLTLGNSDIPELTDRINNLPNLERIILAGNNYITAIPSSVASLNKLKVLDLVRTSISTLPEELRNFEQNIQIKVEETPFFKNPPAQLQTWPENIRFIPPLFGQPRINSIKDRLAKLRTPINYNQYLEWISIGSPILYNIITLNLEPTDLNPERINEITVQIGNLKKLQSLTINNINITELPSTIGTLTELKSIKISNTPLQSLPPSIGALKQLQTLDLANNTSLVTLPPSIGALKKLQSLTLTDTGVETLPETLKDIPRSIDILIGGTPIISNPAYVLQLRSWPPRFKIRPLPAPPPPPPPPPQQPDPLLATIRSQVNPYVKAKDIINVNDDDTVQQLLNEGYKIFMSRELYYATSLDLLSGYINDPKNEYYICNRLTNGGFQRTNTNPLVSINIITGFQGFVEKKQLLIALNSQHKYFAISEQGDNVVVIKGHPNQRLHEVCQEANAKKYDIRVIDVIDRTELMSKLKMKTDFSDVFTDVESENEGDDNAGGGRTRRVKRTNKTRTVKRKTVKRRTNKRKTKKRK
jgi:Leucine-rich repeat (LRR) protein